MTTTAIPTPKRPGAARSAARLAAVQALYQIEMSGDRPSKVIVEFRMHRLGHEIEGDTYLPADDDLFADIVDGTIHRLAEIDEKLSGLLAAGWTLERIDRLVRQVLRAGAYELLARPDVPAPVVITEYVDVAGAFYDRQEAAFVNGVLDKLARSAGRLAKP
jgi:N utilization substance protein B